MGPMQKCIHQGVAVIMGDPESQREGVATVITDPSCVALLEFTRGC